MLLLLTFSSATSQTINLRNFTVSDGLANSSTYYSVQDSRGFLWIATSSGVNRFDGKKFELFTTDDGLADNEVLMIFEDSKGRIWFLNFNGRLGYYYDGKFFNPENDKVLENAVIKASFTSCFEDSANRLWFSTNQQQIIEIDQEKVTIHVKPNKELDISNTFIFEDEKNRILAANSKGFYYIDKNTITRAPDRYLPTIFKSLQYDKRTRKLLFISEEGLIERSNGLFKIKSYLPEELPRKGLGSFLLHKNELWVASANNGLYRVTSDGKTMTHHLPKMVISAMMVDRDGNIWITTFGDGLIILPAHTQNVLHYTRETGLIETTTYSVTKDGRDRIWLGLSGIVNLIDGKKISVLNLPTPNGSYDPVKRLEYDKERNSMWLASSNAIAEISVDGSKSRYLREKNNLAFSPKSFSLSKNGKFAFSLASGVYLLENKNEPLVFETAVNHPTQRFFADRAFKIFFDSRERLWFSNVNGLFRFENNRIDTLAKYSKLFSKRITDMIEMPDGKMVIGTYGFGLLILDTTNRVTQIGMEQGLNSNICRRLAFDGKYIWLTTFRGLDRIEYNVPNAPVKTYKVKHGLGSNEVLDIYLDKGNVLLATKAGLTIFPRDEQVVRDSPPLFYITNFSVNGESYKVRDVPELRFEQNNISVSYTAINFSQADESYQYRLKDNAPWIETFNNTIEFGSLEPGNYQLSIRAKLHDSEWSSPATVSFLIRPAFWQRWWFLASAYSLVLLMLTGLVYWYFKKQRQKEQDKLSVQTKILALEQRALQAMMNPHFVFNIMNSIQHFINTKDSQAANKVLTGFARLIRKNLEICTKPYISLEAEIEYLKLYLSLEKLRFGDKMTYSISVDEEIDAEETMIPTMLLQPFVENAIWHGIMPKEEGGTIHIEVHHHNNELTIYIIDNGTGIENSLKNRNSNHVSRGMQITQDRIQLLNRNEKSDISIHTQQTGASGTRVTVKIPV